MSDFVSWDLAQNHSRVQDTSSFHPLVMEPLCLSQDRIMVLFEISLLIYLTWWRILVPLEISLPNFHKVHLSDPWWRILELIEISLPFHKSISLTPSGINGK